MPSGSYKLCYQKEGDGFNQPRLQEKVHCKGLAPSRTRVVSSSTLQLDFHEPPVARRSDEAGRLQAQFRSRRGPVVLRFWTKLLVCPAYLKACAASLRQELEEAEEASKTTFPSFWFGHSCHV